MDLSTEQNTASGEPVVFTRRGFNAGFRQSLVPLIGALPFAAVIGLTAQIHHLSFAEAGIMSGWMFAGAAQILVLASWTAPVSIVAAILTSFVVNTRFLLMGPLLAPWLDSMRGWRRWGGLFFLNEVTWALSLQAIREGKRDAAFFVGSGFATYLVHLLGTLLGFLLGFAIAPVAGHPIFFPALAVFIAMLVPMWRGRSDLLPWVVAAATAVLVHHFMPGTSWHILAGAVVGAGSAFLRDRLKAVTA